MYENEVGIIEFGSGVYLVWAKDRDDNTYKKVAYLVVEPPEQPSGGSGGSNGTETWYTVVSGNNFDGHVAWGPLAPAVGNDNQELRFDWLQEDTSSFQPPHGANKPTYRKWVQTVAPYVTWP